MKLLYFILTLFLGLTGYLSYQGFSNHPYINAMAQNVFSEIFGIIITLVLVDTILERNKAKESKRMRKIGMKYLRGEISKHLRMLCRLYKGGMEKYSCTKVGCEDMNVFFDEAYFDVVRTINHNKKVPDITEGYSYLEYINARCEELTESIQKTLRLYEKYFDPHDIEKMEDLTESDFIKVVTIFNKATKINHKPLCDLNNLLGSEDGKIEKSFKAYVGSVKWLVGFYNEVTEFSNPIVFKTEAWEVQPLHYGGGIDPLIEKNRMLIKNILDNN